MDLSRAESEKITINLGYVDLGRIDLLVREGFYSNRSDLIRTAIRNQLAGHADEVRSGMERRKLDLGLRHLSKADLDSARTTPIDINVVGLVVIADDVSPELARASIKGITVLGHLQASAAVRAALADRIR